MRENNTFSSLPTLKDIFIMTIWYIPQNTRDIHVNHEAMFTTVQLNEYQ